MGPEWVASFLSAVGILLQRIDRREDRLEQRTDLLEPLLELYHRVGKWIAFAEVTNDALRKYRRAATRDERFQAAQEALGAAIAQADVGATAVVHVGFPEAGRHEAEHEDRLTFRDLLTIYAPDLEEHFRQVVEVRMEQLEALRRQAKRVAMSRNVSSQQSAMDMQDVLTYWVDNPDILGKDTISEKDLEDFERSKDLLIETQRELASYIRDRWDIKDINLRRSSFR
jgi:hypothetical protein